MSMTAVKPYFKARMLALGYREHADGFNTDNIPSVLFDKVFHIELGSFSGVKLNQALLDSSCPVVIKLPLQGGRKPNECVDRAIVLGEAIIKETCKASNRISSVIRNVMFDQMTIEPLGQSNDNAMILTLNFTASVMTDVEGT